MGLKRKGVWEFGTDSQIQQLFCLTVPRVRKCENGPELFCVCTLLLVTPYLSFSSYYFTTCL